jgi:hypothetical protein
VKSLGIIERRIKERVQPDGVDAEAFHIVQFRNDSRQIADPVAVGIIEGLGIDLVDNGVVNPARAIRDDILTGDLWRGDSTRDDREVGKEEGAQRSKAETEGHGRR